MIEQIVINLPQFNVYTHSLSPIFHEIVDDLKEFGVI